MKGATTNGNGTHSAGNGKPASDTDKAARVKKYLEELDRRDYEYYADVAARNRAAHRQRKHATAGA